MSRGVQTTYGELAKVLGDLPLLVHEARRARRLSLRAAAAEIGCNFNTVQRIESGAANCRLSNVVAVLVWLDRKP